MRNNFLLNQKKMSDTKQFKYEIYKPVVIEVRTIILATSEEEALKLSEKRDISICHHGTEDYDAEEGFVLTGDVHTEWEGDLNPYINDINF